MCNFVCVCMLVAVSSNKIKIHENTHKQIILCYKLCDSLAPLHCEIIEIFNQIKCLLHVKCCFLRMQSSFVFAKKNEIWHLHEGMNVWEGLKEPISFIFSSFFLCSTLPVCLMAFYKLSLYDDVRRIYPSLKWSSPMINIR